MKYKTIQISHYNHDLLCKYMAEHRIPSLQEALERVIRQNCTRQQKIVQYKNKEVII